MTTSVPAIVWNPATGPDLPVESDILNGVLSDYNTAFGYTLNPALETPQGQLASSLSAIIGDCNSQWAYLINQIDPATSDGMMQDAIGRIYYIARDPAEATAVQCLCVGLPGTPIPVGAQIADNSGNVYSCVQAGEIAGNGNITLQFQNNVYGPIPCPSGTITQIYKSIPGWDAVSNTVDGVIGNDVESRSDFEMRRTASVALNAQGSPAAIYGAVFSVTNIIDVYVAENTNYYSITEGATNYALLPHSIYIAAVGGDSQAIANAIYTKKGTGCDYNGNTTMTVVDDSGYNLPYPSYQIIFNIPTPTPILFACSIAANNALPSNVSGLVTLAIINAFAGGDGGSRARIGSTIYAYRYVAPVMAVDPNIEILSLSIGLDMPIQGYITLGIDQVPTISASNINVTIV